MSKLFGVLGHSIGHSLSPTMFAAAFWQYNIEADYQRFDLAPKDVELFLKEMRTGELEGLSVTIPYKETVIDFLNDIDEKAELIGAVNTIVKKNGKLKGFNTDWMGAQKALEEQMALEGKQVLVLGAGGAAAAIVYACIQKGAKVTVLNRSLEKAVSLVVRFAGVREDIILKAGTLDEILAYPSDILIHTTSIGMTPHMQVSLVPMEYFKKGLVVFDIVYNPLETLLVKQAKAAGCKIIPGYKMLLYQAEKQFELWFKKKAPIEKMETALVEALRN